MADEERQTGQADAPRPSVFLSYTRTDSERARQLISALEQSGFDMWWDGLIEGGVDYLPTIESALLGADCVIVLWSHESVESAWVRDEAESGRDRGRLVPVTLDGTIAPLGFQQLQLIDVRGWKGDPKAPEVQRIVSAVERAIEAGQSGGRTTGGHHAHVLPPLPAERSGLSRRTLVLGGLGVGVAGAALGAWQFGLLPGSKSDTAVAMAVLGFANLTEDEDQAWFTSGLSSELRQKLARNPLLRVSAPTSSTLQTDEDDFSIGRALGVPNILRGSVQRAGDIVRISAELVAVEDGMVRWGETYDRKLEDVFAVQTEIASTVALRLVAQIASESEAARSIADQEGVGGTKDLQAYEAFLRGSALADASAGYETDRSALEQFETAIRIDPAFAKAHAMRAQMLAAVANATDDSADWARLYDASIKAAERAIELAPTLPKGHYSLGFSLNNGRLDPKAARPHYTRALELTPGDADVQRAVGLFYAYNGEGAEALRLIETALKLDPINPRAFRTAGFVALMAGGFATASDHGEKALSFGANLSSANYIVGVSQYMLGDLAKSEVAFAQEPVPLFGQVGLAIVRHRLGRQAEAKAVFDEMVAEYGDAGLYQQVQVLAQWGEKARAIELLAQATELKDPGLLFAPSDPLIDPLRDMPEFDRIIAPLAW